MILVGDKNSRGKLSAGMGARGFENKMWECHAAKNMCAKSLLENAATALTLCNSWTEESPYKEELALLRSASGRQRCEER